MKTISEAEQQALYDNFETTTLLDAIDGIDEVCQQLIGGITLEQPQIRSDFFKLHPLAMDVFNHGYMEQVPELFDMAIDLDMQIADVVEVLAGVQKTLNKLLELYPESLSDG